MTTKLFSDIVTALLKEKVQDLTKFKVPAKPADVINKIADLDLRIKALNSYVDYHDEMRKLLKKSLDDYLVSSGSESAASDNFTASRVPKEIFIVDEASGGKDAIWDYIFKNKAKHLLQFTLVQKAVEEEVAKLAKARKKFKGVSKFKTYRLSITKRKNKGK